MKQELIKKLHTAFEEAAYEQEGVEYWLARDLQLLLGYDDWKNFIKVIAKAKEACTNSGQLIEDHFSDIGKMVALGSGAKRQISDLMLTRYACYLIAQNGDQVFSGKFRAKREIWWKIQSRHPVIPSEARELI